MVFENNKIQPNIETEGWDGYFKSDLMNPGVYVYYVEVLFADGLVKTYSGDLTLVK